MSTSPGMFWNSPKMDAYLFFRYLRASLNAGLRPKDNLSLLTDLPYDHLLAPSVEVARDYLGSCDKGFFRIPRWRLWNGSYAAIDAQFYYSLLRRTQPRQIIEVGAGNSTWFAAHAVSRNKVAACHTVIAPDPQTSRLPSHVTFLRCKVEEVPIERFETLQDNDILFIDSSHTTDEALYHVKQILPRLHSGVLVHHHDVCYPYVAPAYLQPSSTFGESEVVLRFYQEHQEQFQILAGLAFARSRLSDEELLGLVPSMRWNLSYYPGALWTRKK